MKIKLIPQRHFLVSWQRMSSSQAFEQLHPIVQRWIYQQGWDKLRSAQEQAIEPIMSGEDVIIAAPTASGKTEAAFLPALSKVAFDSEPGSSVDGTTGSSESISILYVAPLKALINDQERRLEALCEDLELQLTPWHGDASQGAKQRLRKHPSGVLMITPESLEALLIRQMSWAKKAFANLQYVIIDEFHAFIGTERGMQLQSLLTRLEFLIGKTVPRIALSATFSDTKTVGDLLRPNASSSNSNNAPGTGKRDPGEESSSGGQSEEAGLKPFAEQAETQTGEQVAMEKRSSAKQPIVIQDTSGSYVDLKLQLRGYLDPADENRPPAQHLIDQDLYQLLRGENNLIFANSRKLTEHIAAELADMAREEGVPNEFFAHHGSLSKEHRHHLEQRLKEGKWPSTVCATSTLELGIDIGTVASVAQIGVPTSVSSLRQRLGRSGRRDQPAILRLFEAESEPTAKTPAPDLLCWRTVQTIAAVNLLLKKWYEPPNTHSYHFSTLVQQVLATTAQYGGVHARQLYQLLCRRGPFINVTPEMFGLLLRGLGAKDMLTQMSDGQLTLGAKGESLVGHYSFYSAFQTPEEYRLVSGGKTIGQLPIDHPVAVEQNIIFQGRRWKIEGIEEEAKVILLKPAGGGAPPDFGGVQGLVAHEVRQEMKRVYLDPTPPIYLDQAALENLQRGQKTFQRFSLDKRDWFKDGELLYLAPWLSDRGLATMTVLLRSAGIKADCFLSPFIEVKDKSWAQVEATFKRIEERGIPKSEQLAQLVEDTMVEKHDGLLLDELRRLGYGQNSFDVDEVKQWFGSGDEIS